MDNSLVNNPDIMGNILSSTTDVENASTETQEINTNTEDLNLTTENNEVSELFPSNSVINLNTAEETIPEDVNSTSIENESCVSMEEIEPVGSSTEVTQILSSQESDNSDAWLGEDTKNLVKLDTNDDFEGIVKSLETAIVETEIDNYDTSNQGITIVSSSATLESDIISSSNTESIITTETLLGDLTQNLDSSPLPTLAEIALQNEETDPGIIETQEPVIILPTVADSQDFSSDFSEQSTNLFAADQEESYASITTEILNSQTITTDSSLLDLQESSLPADILEDPIKDLVDSSISHIENNPDIDPCLSDASIIYSSSEEINDDENILNSNDDLKETFSSLHESDNKKTLIPEVSNTEKEEHISNLLQFELNSEINSPKTNINELENLSSNNLLIENSEVVESFTENILNIENKNETLQTENITSNIQIEDNLLNNEPIIDPNILIINKDENQESINLEIQDLETENNLITEITSANISNINQEIEETFVRASNNQKDADKQNLIQSEITKIDRKNTELDSNISITDPVAEQISNDFFSLDSEKILESKTVEANEFLILESEKLLEEKKIVTATELKEENIIEQKQISSLKIESDFAFSNSENLLEPENVITENIEKSDLKIETATIEPQISIKEKETELSIDETAEKVEFSENKTQIEDANLVKLVTNSQNIIPRTKSEEINEEKQTIKSEESEEKVSTSKKIKLVRQKITEAKVVQKLEKATTVAPDLKIIEDIPKHEEKKITDAITKENLGNFPEEPEKAPEIVDELPIDEKKQNISSIIEEKSKTVEIVKPSIIEAQQIPEIVKPNISTEPEEKTENISKIEFENKTPVKTQKLKLRRNYQPPSSASKPVITQSIEGSTTSEKITKESKTNILSPEKIKSEVLKQGLEITEKESQILENVPKQDLTEKISEIKNIVEKTEDQIEPDLTEKEMKIEIQPEVSSAEKEMIPEISVLDTHKTVLKEETDSQKTVLKEGSDAHKIVLQEESDPHKIVLQEGSDPHKTVLQEESDPHKTVLQEKSDLHKIVLKEGSDPHKIVLEEKSGIAPVFADISETKPAEIIKPFETETKNFTAQDKLNLTEEKIIEPVTKTDNTNQSELLLKTLLSQGTHKHESKEVVEEPKKSKMETDNNIQFPLLMSRLQDKLHSKPKIEMKTNIPTTVQEIRITKPEEAHHVAPLITTKPAAEPLQLEITASLTASSSMLSPKSRESTKLKVIKRKYESSEAMTSRSVTKPLSVEVDDLESTDFIGEEFECSLTPTQNDHENIPKLVIKQIPRPEQRSSPKITIKPIKPPGSPDVSGSKRSKLSSDDSSPTRITIKSVNKQEPLKFTITKQKSDDTHSILKIYQPEDSQMTMEETHVPKLTIKSIPKSEETQTQHSPKITIKPVKPPGSPKITVKQVVPPNEQHVEITPTKQSAKSTEESYPKVTIKPVLKPEDSQKLMQSRQIKLKSMTFDSASGVTVEPVCSTSSSIPQELHLITVKTPIKLEEQLSPKLTIKPITKTCEIVQSEDGSSNPLKLTIKPILKSEESYQSPKITIKPIIKPEEYEQQINEEPEKQERIILKIQKTNLPSPKERSSMHVKESKKETESKAEPGSSNLEVDKNQKLDKIKLKLTKEGSHAQIIPTVPSSVTSETFSIKRSIAFTEPNIAGKRCRTEFSEFLHSSDISINIVEPNTKPNLKQISEEVTIVKIDKPSSSGKHLQPQREFLDNASQMKFKEMLLKISQKPEITCIRHIQEKMQEDSSSSDDVKIVDVSQDPLEDPLNIQDDSSSQDVMIVNEVIDTNPFKDVQILNPHTITEPLVLPSPKKRGRPRKNPLEVKPEIKGEDCVEVDVRPKRTCRAPAGRTPFAVKERKPRGAGRGRGSTRGARGARTAQKTPKETKTSRAKALKEAKELAKIEAAKLSQEIVIDEITIEDSTNDTTSVPPHFNEAQRKSVSMVEPGGTIKIPEIVKINQINEDGLKEPQPPPVAVYEEETRMSASENNSRAQTPARQVFIVPLSEGPEESQSSVQSTATTESNKQSKKGRLEICDPESTVTTVEQIVEYSWGNGGPYMLQEQIAQYLGVKSFKRKYPGLNRRPVEMQERDYIREKGLVSESMCDMGLTAVPSSEILDIMYSDFQDKYEEYRKCLRDKQSKEITNKQRAISLATSQEKNKLDFKERAIKSAANWNITFNKNRKESRKCCMDLQTFTINFPVGKTPIPNRNSVGHYPIALVPGQFTDYFKAYASSDLNYLPLNTVRYGPLIPNQYCFDGNQSDGSQSETDSSSGSDSDSSDESMSTEDEISQSNLSTISRQSGVNLNSLSASLKHKLN